jgi:hypothetical protein
MRFTNCGKPMRKRTKRGLRCVRLCGAGKRVRFVKNKLCGIGTRRKRRASRCGCR